MRAASSLLAALHAAALAALIGCSGGSPSAPATEAPRAPAQLTPLEELPVAYNPGSGLFTTVMGYAHVRIDEDLNIELTFPRQAEAQFDQTRLTLRPFLTKAEVTPVAITRGLVAGKTTVNLVLNFRHPFDEPVDLILPASPAKRADLHGFKPLGLVIVDGGSQFNFDTPTDSVRAVTDFLLNPSGYIKPGALLDLPPLTADTFAYRHITPLDPGMPNNYDPLAGGWVDAPLVFPQGFGVFGMGTNHDCTFILTPPFNGIIDFDLAILGEYQQPKKNDLANPTLPKPWLPDPSDPDRLRYVCPTCAGDNSEVTLEFPDVRTNHLPMDNAVTTNMIVNIVDWDNQTATTPTWPDLADLSLGPEASGTQSVTAVIPGVTAAAAIGFPLVGGDGSPDAPIRYQVVLRNTANQPVPGPYLGLVRVEDEQTGTQVVDISEVTDGEGNRLLGPPIATLPTVTYQSFEVILEDTVCADVAFQIVDLGGSPSLQNNESLRFLATRTGPAVPVSPWDIDVAWSDDLVEDPPLQSGLDLTTPYVSVNTTGTVQNNSRLPGSVTLNIQLGNPSPLGDCNPVIAMVEGNAEPTCPATVTITDQPGGVLQLGDRVRVNFSGITDADNAQGEITVQAAFDFDSNGTPEETLSGTAASLQLTTVQTLIGAGLVSVTLTIGDNAGPIPACAKAQQPVFGCPLVSVGNIALETQTSDGLGGWIDRGTVGLDQRVGAIEIWWADTPSEGAYAIYRATWPQQTALSLVTTWVQVGEVPANTTSFIDAFSADPSNFARGRRYLYRVNARCVPGGADGPRSDLAMVALQDFEGVAVGSSIIGASPLGMSDWVVNAEDPAQSAVKVTSPGLNGTRCLDVERLPAAGLGASWLTFGTPSMTNADVVGMGNIQRGLIEFSQSRANSWLGGGGMTIICREGRPSNGGGAATGSNYLQLLDSGPKLYDTAFSLSLDSDFPGIALQHALGGEWCFGTGSLPFTETFSRVDTTSGTVGNGALFANLAFAATNQGDLHYRLDDLAWIVY